MFELLAAEKEAEVDGYPNYRLYSFFTWLDNDQPWRKAEVEALDRATRSIKRNGGFTPGGRAVLNTFYHAARYAYERQVDADYKLQPWDWTLLHREVEQRFEALATDRQEAVQAEIARTTQPAPFPLPPANFYTLRDKAVDRFNHRLEHHLFAGNPQWRRAECDRARREGLFLGPSPCLSHPSIDLLQGRAILITLASGEVVEIKPGDEVRQHGYDGWREVLDAWDSDRSGAFIQYAKPGKVSGYDYLSEYLDYSGNAGGHGRFYQIAAVRAKDRRTQNKLPSLPAED